MADSASSFVVCVRNPKGADFGTSLGPSRYLEVPSTEATPRPDHATRFTSWIAAVRERARSHADDARDIVLFVHGYDTSAAEALVRQRLLERELGDRGYPAVVLGFTWPTEGNKLAYLADRDDAFRSAPAFITAAIEPFLRSLDPSCRSNVHLVAHSSAPTTFG